MANNQVSEFLQKTLDKAENLLDFIEVSNLSHFVYPVLEDFLLEVSRVSPTDPIEWLGRNLQDFSRSLRRTNPSQVVTTQKEIYFVLGGPGSGKGTQCKHLMQKLGFDHFSVGDSLRDEIATGSKQGKMIEEIMRQGQFVSSEITINLLRKAIDNSKADALLIDGFPRNLQQAGAFEKEISSFNRVLFFECPEETMEKRTLERGKTSGRLDDNIETIKKRIYSFVQTTMPVIEYYEARGKVYRFDTTKSVDEVTQEIIALLATSKE